MDHELRTWMRLVESRPVITESRSAPLYHGTRLASLLHIIETDSLDSNGTTSLSRSYQVAHYFSESDSPYEDFGAILVLDQQKLIQRHRIEPFQDRWASENPDHQGFADEQEEVVHGALKPLSPFLISINADPEMLRAAARERDYIRTDHEMNQYFNRRKRVAQKLIVALLSHPLLNKWAPRFATNIAPVRNSVDAW